MHSFINLMDHVITFDLRDINKNFAVEDYVICGYRNFNHILLVSQVVELLTSGLNFLQHCVSNFADLLQTCSFQAFVHLFRAD